MVFPLSLVFAQTAPVLIDDDFQTITVSDIGATSDSEINNATEEETAPVTETGTLVEIGNTTADETTVIVRTTDENNATQDETVEIETGATDLENNDGGSSDLNDWIAGDQITFDATENTNSGSIHAKRMVNRSIRRQNRGINGWITAIRIEENAIDVSWNKTIYTLNTAKARIVAGIKNPATINDLVVGDRIRARAIEDGDGNDATQNASIVVVLRRGKDLFMRVTRWVVAGKISYINENPTLPTVITIEILPSRFYQDGDVNNLVGAPGAPVSVNITDKTKLRRRYLGKSLITEFSAGDRIQVIGRRNEATNQIDAVSIRNASIQKLNVGYRTGIVDSVDADAHSISAKTKQTDRSWKITTTDATKFIKGGQDIAFTDIQAGDNIRVRGVADRKTNIVQASMVVVLVKREEVQKNLEAAKNQKLEEFRAKKDEIFQKIKTKRDAILVQ